MSHDGRWSNADQDRILLSEPDPDWPRQFAAEAARLREALPEGMVCDIIHVGSTAVPGLLAKPVIDMLLIPWIHYWRPAVIDVLEGMGYVHWRDNPRPDRVFLVKGMPPFGNTRTHHAHIRTDREARDLILFRDCLIANPRIAEEYGSLKRTLAARFASDREGYTEAKAEFVRRVLWEADAGHNRQPNSCLSRCRRSTVTRGA